MDFTREQLEKRRDAILEQLNRTNSNIREEFELDPDPEEQAIQVEQSEVLVTMEANLRTELAMIEDALLDMK